MNLLKLKKKRTRGVNGSIEAGGTPVKSKSVLESEVYPFFNVTKEGGQDG